MILFVDDEEMMRSYVSDVLETAGLEVRAVANAEQAMVAAETDDPDLIISDVMMPDIDGLAFHEDYRARFPHRRTPFLFLSALGEPEDIVRGLEVGADDYLTKPFEPDVLVAKVRAQLRRSRREATSVFVGQLDHFPFANVLQFCEEQGFHGEAEVSSDDFYERFRFRGGVLAPGEAEKPGDPLGRCLALKQGRFVLTASHIDFSALQHADIAPEQHPEAPRPAEPAAPAPAVKEKQKPAGRLSGVKAGNRLFQIQTEFATAPECRAVTVVILDGKTVLKRASPPTPDWDLPSAEKLMTEQHLKVEQEVREKLGSLASKQPSSSKKDQFERLFEEGLTRFMSNDYAGAVATWEQAKAIDSGNAILESTLAIARKKMGAAGG